MLFIFFTGSHILLIVFNHGSIEDTEEHGEFLCASPCCSISVVKINLVSLPVICRN